MFAGRLPPWAEEGSKGGESGLRRHVLQSPVVAPTYDVLRGSSPVLNGCERLLQLELQFALWKVEMTLNPKWHRVYGALFGAGLNCQGWNMII